MNLHVFRLWVYKSEENQQTAQTESTKRPEAECRFELLTFLPRGLNANH